MTESERRSRQFSESFRKQKVRDLEHGRVTCSELCRQYEVSSTTVYRWVAKFGSMQSKKERLIMETDSDTRQLLELRKKVAELERLVGQKQIMIDFQAKMIELAEDAYDVDIKKKFSTRPSDTPGETDTN